MTVSDLHVSSWGKGDGVSDCRGTLLPVTFAKKKSCLAFLTFSTSAVFTGSVSVSDACAVVCLLSVKGCNIDLTTLMSWHSKTIMDSIKNTL